MYTTRGSQGKEKGEVRQRENCQRRYSKGGIFAKKRGGLSFLVKVLRLRKGDNLNEGFPAEKGGKEFWLLEVSNSLAVVNWREHHPLRMTGGKKSSSEKCGVILSNRHQNWGTIGVSMGETFAALACLIREKSRTAGEGGGIGDLVHTANAR